MLDKLFLTIFLLLLLIFPSFSEGAINNKYDKFNEIITINNETKELVNANFNDLDYYKLFYYYCFISEESNKYDEYLEWFKKIENEIDKELYKEFKVTNIKKFDAKKQKEFAEELLKQLHKKVFIKYRLNSNKISELIINGEYNCVSSSIIYSIFLKKYNFKNNAVETLDHVFIKILFSDREIDVETTNVYGFNPGNKKEVLDAFGRVTGFNYIPQQDYKNRNNISIKTLFMLINHNLSTLYFKAGESLKAVKLSYIIKLGRDDKKGNNDFRQAFQNYIAVLSNKNKYFEAIYTTNSYIEKIEWDNNLINIRFNILHNYVVDWNDYENNSNTKLFLLQQNERFSKIKDDKRFIEIYLFYTYKLIEHYLKFDSYNKAYLTLKDFQKFYNKDTKNIFTNIMLGEMEYYIKNNQEDLVVKRINELQSEYKDYNDEISKYEISYYNDKINLLYKNNSLTEALKISKNLYEKYPLNNNTKQIYRNSYIKITVNAYDNNDYNTVIKYSDEGLKLFPGDKILKNNYISFLYNFIYYAIENKNYNKARNLIEISKKKFPDNKFYSDADEYLKKQNY